MILFPAVDIKDGQCVRLKQGKADQVTIFSKDPVAMAGHWADKGAQWLHLVDLDGAFSGMPKNYELIKSICSSVDIPVQLGGGVRDIKVARSYIEAGVRRLIIGTMALENPDEYALVCKELPGKIGVSLDAVDGKLKTKGWVDDANMKVDDVLPRLESQGTSFIVYTDIARDGMQSGVNYEAMEKLTQKTSMPVIAAGGVTTLDDVKQLFPLASKGLEGVITGRAIYAGTLDFSEGLQWLRSQN